MKHPYASYKGMALLVEENVATEPGDVTVVEASQTPIPIARIASLM
jgi:hypothetical protein